MEVAPGTDGLRPPHLCVTTPDASGFQAFDHRRNSEAVALKGLLWGRWGQLVIINTHMTFHYSDDGSQRRAQQQQLSALVHRILVDGCPCSGARVSQVMVGGDFNHCLPGQVSPDGQCGQRPLPGSPSVYTGPWLPLNASLQGLVARLELDGQFQVQRLSGDVATCEDGTVDHVFTVTRASHDKRFEALRTFTEPDDTADTSDHLMIGLVARLQS